MFKEHPSHKKGMERPGKSAGKPHHSAKNSMEGFSKIEGKSHGNSMEHHSKLLAGKKAEPKVLSHYFGDA